MRLIILLFFFVFLSCQKVEVIQPIVFDNSQLKIITINASEKIINNNYNSKFSDPYIDHSLKNPPIERFKSWANTNIKTFGNENVIEINILEASIKRIEEKNSEAKKFEEKSIYKYESFLLVEYNLYNNSNYLLASTSVENFRSTTSGQFISIFETERIIDELILEALRDISNESKILINRYMSDYIL